MKIKKNKFVIFYVFNIVLLIILLLLAIPASKFLSKMNLDDNEFVTDQVVVNPNAKSPKIIERTMQIQFVAIVDDFLNWDFKALQDTISIKIGENKVISYEGKNLSNRTITSTANFIVSPESILPYLVKVECFCFTEQPLQPREIAKLKLTFFVNPDFAKDEYMNDVNEITLSYTFFNKNDKNEE